MATTANTAAKKKPSTTKATSSKPTTVVEEKVTKVEPKVEKKVFKDSDGIPCRSITQGALYMEGLKSHMLYEWVGYGDVTMVEYADLASAVRVKSQFLFAPNFIIDDEDFVDQMPQLKKFYTENYSARDIEALLHIPIEKMRTEIATLPKSAVESLKSIAASAITKGELDSIKRVKVLDELLDTNLSILAEFEN